MYNGNFRGAIMIHRSYFGKVFVLKTHHWNAQIQEARNKPLLHALCHDWLYHVIVELSQYLFAPSGGILIAESNNVLLEEIEVSGWYTRYDHLNHLPTYSHMGDPSIIYNNKKNTGNLGHPWPSWRKNCLKSFAALSATSSCFWCPLQSHLLLLKLIVLLRELSNNLYNT